MVIEIKLTKISSRLVVGAVTLVACALIATAAVTGFVISSLTDQGADISPSSLESARTYFKSSAHLSSRIAEIELVSPERDLAVADREATRATHLSPNDYRNLLVLASVKEAEGDLASAEKNLFAALALAPANADVHWRVANLLLREGQMDRGLEILRSATSANPSTLPSALDLVWKMTGGSHEAIEGLTTVSNPASRLELARFLLMNSSVEEAISVFRGVDMKSRLASTVTRDFISRLDSMGRTASARKLWMELIGSDAESDRGQPIWDGSFEMTPAPVQAPFDWTFAPSNFAQITVDPEAAHTGTRSLRIDFIGRQNTRLGGEVKQTIPLQPGASYRLECYTKTDRLSGSEGPRIAMSSTFAPSWAAVTEPVALGTAGWSKLVFDFVAPQLDSSVSQSGLKISGADSSPALITILHAPKTTYDTPMRGSVWFDDFQLTRRDER